MGKITKSQQTTYDAFIACGRDVSATAKELGINRAAVQKNLFNGHINGLTVPTEFCKHLPAGMELKAASVYVDKHGEMGGRWYKGDALKQTQEEVFSYLKKRVPVNKFKVRTPHGVNDQLQLEWCLADLHFGQLAWGAECGENYNMKISRELVLDSASDIFSRSGKVKESVLVLMGDNFHADSTENKTRKSHHSLDVDSRYQKIIPAGVDTFASAIEICLSYSKKVKVVVLYGNHDESTSQLLPWLLHFYFFQNPRVEVDLGVSKGRFNFWGRCASIYYHGDTTKPDRICSELMQHIAKNDLTGFRYFFAKQAHLHKEEIHDIQGVIFERVPSPVARDSFASAYAYGSRRATVASVYHKDGGDIHRIPVTVQGLQWKKKNLHNQNK